MTLPRTKCVLVGDVGVGKTSIVHRWVEGKFKHRYIATIGVDILSKTLDLGTLDVWDLAGQDQYKDLRHRFYHQASTAIFVTDLTVTSSLHSLDQWYAEVNAHTTEPLLCVMVANKSDLKSQRAIQRESMEELRQDSRFSGLFETSALTGEGVDELFRFVGQTIFNQQA